jgi:hypothetical protein
MVEIIDDGVDMVHGATSDCGHMRLLESSLEGVTAPKSVHAITLCQH